MKISITHNDPQTAQTRMLISFGRGSFTPRRTTHTHPQQPTKRAVTNCYKFFCITRCIVQKNLLQWIHHQPTRKVLYEIIRDHRRIVVRRVHWRAVCSILLLLWGLNMPKISVTSKLDGIRSWSLQALETCPGSIASPGVLVDACKGCYATTGNYVFANVKAPREFNRTDWERFAWVDDMVQELERDRYFRWFDSGDVYSLALAEKILEVMQRTPWCKHWLPTRMHKFPKFAMVLQAMQALPNVMVRPSSDSIVGEFIAGLHGSVIVPDSRVNPGMVTLCRAYEHEGKCNGCRACYSKDVPVIAYPAHGARMGKVIRLKVAA